MMSDFCEKQLRSTQRNHTAQLCSGSFRWRSSVDKRPLKLQRGSLRDQRQAKLSTGVAIDFCFIVSSNLSRNTNTSRNSFSSTASTVSLRSRDLDDDIMNPHSSRWEVPIVSAKPLTCITMRPND